MAATSPIPLLSGATPADGRPLREAIKDEIIERILNGVYAPGDRVVESALAAEFGTSQAPVREALREIEAMRLIETHPHRGARVRAVTIEEILETYPVRAALEEVAGREAALHVTSRVLDDLESEMSGMREAAADGDAHRQMGHDAAFHRVIVEASANRVLIDVWSSLRIEARTMISVVKATPDLRMLAEMHRPVLEALRIGNPEMTGREMRQHIEFIGSLVASSHARSHSEEHVAPPQ